MFIATTRLRSHPRVGGPATFKPASAEEVAKISAMRQNITRP